MNSFFFFSSELIVNRILFKKIIIIIIIIINLSAAKARLTRRKFRDGTPFFLHQCVNFRLLLGRIISILGYRYFLWALLKQAIYTMASFYYYDQNAFRFSSHI